MLNEKNLDQQPRAVVLPREPNLCKRVAMGVAQIAQRFQSDILLIVGSLHIDGKSSLMTVSVQVYMR